MPRFPEPPKRFPVESFVKEKGKGGKLAGGGGGGGRKGNSATTAGTAAFAAAAAAAAAAAQPDGGKGQTAAAGSGPKTDLKTALKTHRDHLLEEMAWLAKDVIRERTWKQRQAKALAHAAKKSGMDVEARRERILRDAETARRKTASGIAKEVGFFWTKVEKLVLMKYQHALDSTRKVALDKHLDFILDQTEKYSGMLADDLTNKPTTPALPAPEARTTKRRPAANADGAGPSRAQAPKDDDAFAGMDLDDEGEFVAGDDGDDGVDDEATLEEEERLKAREGGEDDEAAELAALQAEASMTVEELMARYKGKAPMHDDEEEEEEEEMEEPPEAEAADVRDEERAIARAALENGGEDDEGEFVAGDDGDDGVDDEATLEDMSRRRLVLQRRDLVAHIARVAQGPLGARPVGQGWHACVVRGRTDAERAAL